MDKLSQILKYLLWKEGLTFADILFLFIYFIWVF